jgi:hypothetical protein
VLLHSALAPTANRSRRIITVALSIAALALCSIPYIVEHKLHIEPDLVRTFEGLDESAKVTCSNRDVFGFCHVCTTFLLRF